LSNVHALIRRLPLLAIAAVLALAMLLPAAASAGGRHGHGHDHFKQWLHSLFKVDVMTRNVYLGADLTPAITAPDAPSFIAANGKILRDVTANNFPLRAKGLAAEILAKKPDLVGLQEVALWRTGPPSLTPVFTGEPTATTVRYDYLKLLLDRLNKGFGTNYRVAVAQNQFDLEAPADENQVAGDGPGGPLANAEINGRLTMRDVILEKVGLSVATKNPQSANFENLQEVPAVGGAVTLTIKRGWTAVDARVPGSGWFRFVNTHLEAFHPIVRQEQAGELVDADGPATSDLPVILLGDINSDDDTVAFPDTLAYNTLLAAGMVNRSTNNPLSCCLNSSLLEVGQGGSVADFDHQVDHILTRDPDVFELKSSSVSGLNPVNGFWNSDHAGVFSSLR
jgi:endonuclease/exonuclease/phosphatase family metal-dependent hydrolase